MTARWQEDNVDEIVRFCQTEDATAAFRLCKWPDGDIPISIVATPPGVTDAEWAEVFGRVCGWINAACGARLHLIDTARLARILPGSRKIDGLGGVLAESELPCGNAVYCRQWYDGENWELVWPPADPRKINANLVALHEVMHALGIPHAPENADAVIAPFYNRKLRGLRPYDVQQLQLRHGPPVAVPVPTPLPTPGPAPAPTPGGGSMFETIGKIIKFFEDNPWILKLLEGLLNRAAVTGKITLADVQQEVAQLRQP